MKTQEVIINQLSADLFVEHNLIVEEILTASSLKALFRATAENWENYPRLREALAGKF
jgi:hypothetical protein